VLGNLRLDAAKGNENNVGLLVAVVLEGLVDGAKFVVEVLQQLHNLAGGVEPLVEVLDLGRELLVEIGDAGLAESIDDAKRLARDTHAVIDVQRRQQRGQKGGEDGHVLSLVGGGAGDQAQAQVFGQSQGRIIVGHQALASRVVGSGNVRNERAGDAIQEAELVQGAAQLLEAARGGDERLGDVALGHVKVGREDVAQGQGASTSPRLKGQHRCRIVENVVLAVVRPLLEGHIEVESLRGVGEDLVGQLVCDLLNEQLGRHVGRARDGGQGHGLAKGQARGLLLEARHRELRARGRRGE
jgi:hypothetical protein